MVRQYHWHDPAVLRKVILRINIALWLVIGMILYLQHTWILRLFKQLIESFA